MNPLKKMATEVRKNRRKDGNPLAPEQIQAFTNAVFGQDLHAKRVLSLANGVAGVLRASTLSIHAIGKGLAAAAGANSKRCIKQVDRLLSNAGLDVWELLGTWVPFVVGVREELVVALDWTDFEPDDQTMIALHLITSHGRTTPLVWKTVRKLELSGQQTLHEDAVIERLHEVLPPSHVFARLTALVRGPYTGPSPIPPAPWPDGRGTLVGAPWSGHPGRGTLGGAPRFSDPTGPLAGGPGGRGAGPGHVVRRDRRGRSPFTGSTMSS